MKAFPRYTRDGSDALEARIHELTEKASAGIAAIVPEERLEAMLLGGGYGRGEGGVLRQGARDLPYNDLEFFVFLKGHPFLNDRRYGAAIHELEQRLSAEAGIDVEFKITSSSALRRSGPTMFFYDLYHGHRRTLGDMDVFAGAGQHAEASAIPLSEATRLLMNRCSGLLFARDRLSRTALSADDIDFVTRNIAKAKLALGDAVVTATKRYHWSCVARHERLIQLAQCSKLPFLPDVVENHRQGVAFKLHPQCDKETAVELQKELKKIRRLAWQVWSWLESIRLDEPADRPEDYAHGRSDRCPEIGIGRVLLANLKTFGLAPTRFLAGYPRNRLLRALPLLLWNSRPGCLIPQLEFLQRQLNTVAADFAGLIAAYTRLWTRYN